MWQAGGIGLLLDGRKIDIFELWVKLWFDWAGERNECEDENIRDKMKQCQLQMFVEEDKITMKKMSVFAIEVMIITMFCDFHAVCVGKLTNSTYCSLFTALCEKEKSIEMCGWDETGRVIVAVNTRFVSIYVCVRE